MKTREQERDESLVFARVVASATRRLGSSLVRSIFGTRGKGISTATAATCNVIAPVVVFDLLYRRFSTFGGATSGQSSAPR